MAAPDLNSQAFWNDFMRRPEAKAAYQADMRLQQKKSMWLDEKRMVEERGGQRKLLGDELEAAPAEIKKLIAPIFHIKMVERFLWMVYEECQTKGMPFMEKLRDEGTLVHLRKLRENYQEGGEERMASLEDNWLSICNGIADDEEAKKEKKPVNADVHTIKQILEFSQECKREGNNKFREGLYDDALRIYAQADDVITKWKVGDHLKTEKRWVNEYHIACLKNKAQAALKLNLFQTALDAGDAALVIDAEDHKAWYRKLQAEKGLGMFDDAEKSLQRLEDLAPHCPAPKDVARDCALERQKLRAARAKHKEGTKAMLGKAFESGVFGGDRERLAQEAAEAAEVAHRKAVKDEVGTTAPAAAPRPLQRSVVLTEARAIELVDELAAGYGQRWFQDRVQKCARDSGFERMVFLRRLRGIAFDVQRPILEKWGFEGTEHGVREMTAAIRDHSGPDGNPVSAVLRERQDNCLKLLYGGEDGGMLGIMG